MTRSEKVETAWLYHTLSRFLNYIYFIVVRIHTCCHIVADIIFIVQYHLRNAWAFLVPKTCWWTSGEWICTGVVIANRKCHAKQKTRKRYCQTATFPQIFCRHCKLLVDGLFHNNNNIIIHTEHTTPCTHPSWGFSLEVARGGLLSVIPFVTKLHLSVERISSKSQ